MHVNRAQATHPTIGAIEAADRVVHRTLIVAGCSGIVAAATSLLSSSLG